MSRFGNLEFERQSAAESVTEQVADEVRHLRDAEAAMRRGLFEQALRAYGRVIEANPHHAGGWVGQVRMLIELGQFAEAKAWADKALERFPHDPEALSAKAVALARLGDTKAALTFSDSAIEEQQATPYVWLARGDVLLARAEKRAEHCFAKALGLAAQDWLWPWLASRVHFFYRRFSLAMKLASQALALGGNQAVVWLQMGRCQLALGLAGVAGESFSHARELDPSCPDATAAAAEVGVCSPWERWARRIRGWWVR